MWNKRLISLCLIGLAVIHLTPALGVLGPEHLHRLYAISLLDPNLEILMRHRAVLFAILGGLFLIAAFKPRWQLFALTAALISVLSFLWLIWVIGNANPALNKVALVDWVALLLTLAGLGSWWISQRKN